MCVQKGKRQARARPAQFATATIVEFANELQTKRMKFVTRTSGLVQYAG